MGRVEAILLEEVGDLGDISILVGVGVFKAEAFFEVDVVQIIERVCGSSRTDWLRIKPFENEVVPDNVPEDDFCHSHGCTPP